MVQYNRSLQEKKNTRNALERGDHLLSLTRAISDVFTAKDNSIGNSGGTTDVNINVHSIKSL